MPLQRLVDLNLIPVFVAVFETGSVQKAAERLALSASATSHALARLRKSCEDELFTRLGQGLEPTPIARRIYPELRAALDRLRLSMEEARSFDPAHAARRFRIAIPHPLGPLWALALDTRIAALAPGVTLRFDTRTLARDPDERLAEGLVDLLLDWVPIELDRFVNRPLFEERLMVIARRGHPRVTSPPGLRALQAESFVACHMRRRFGPGRATETEIADHGILARLLVSEYMEVPCLVAESDLLGVVPASMARLVREKFSLQVFPLPFDLPQVPIWLVWHETRRHDPGHAWLRRTVAGIVTDLASPGMHAVDVADDEVALG